MQVILYATLALLSLAEAAIVDWAVRAGTLAGAPLAAASLGAAAAGGGGLSGLQWAGVTAAVGSLNWMLFPMARGQLRASGWALFWGRGWILASIGALASGVLLLFAHVVVLVGGLLFASAVGQQGIERAGLVTAGGLAVGIGFGSVAWAYLVGQRGVRVEEVSLPLPGSSPALAALRIVHVTDLHIGPLLRPPALRRYVATINRLDPDLVVLTGDLFDLDPGYVEEGCAALSELRARHGVYAVLGNHDVYVGTEAVASGLQRGGAIRLLRNECERVDVGDAVLCVAGFEDPGRDWDKKHTESPELEALAALVPRDVPTLLLVHRPSYFQQVARLGFPLALAGHTHGGQVSLPWVPEANVARLISPWTRGVARLGGSVLYVNRGLGVAGLPLRLSCPREIALVRLVPPEGAHTAV